mgnify:CR=1 FL=1
MVEPVVPDLIGLLLVLVVPGKQAAGIQSYVKKHTAPYKYPRIVVFKDELPKTISGKIMRSKGQIINKWSIARRAMPGGRGDSPGGLLVTFPPKEK